MANVEISLPLPVLPEGWAGEKDFKAIGQLSDANDRKIEPVGPHFLAYARRVCCFKTTMNITTNEFSAEAQQAYFL
jgi:hypothetical protein